MGSHGPESALCKLPSSIEGVSLLIINRSSGYVEGSSAVLMALSYLTII